VTPFRIVADSGCNLPPWLRQRFNIYQIPFVGILDADVCLKHLQPLLTDDSPDSLASGEGLLFIHSARAVGVDVESIDELFSQLAQQYPDRDICAVDSRSVSVGCGRIVMQAGELREDGSSLSDTARWIEENRLFALQYFSRRFGGSDDAAFEIVRIDDQGILTAQHTDVLGAGRPAYGDGAEESSTEEGLDVLLDLFETRARKPYKAHAVNIVHADNADAAEILAFEINERFGVNKPMFIEMEENLARVLGTGTVGLLFWGEEDKRV